MSWLITCAEGVTLCLRVIPRASRTRVDGTHGDALKIRLQAPPVDGKANKALVDFLAGQLHVPKSAVSLIQGETSRDKVVRIQGISAERARTLASS